MTRPNLSLKMELKKVRRYTMENTKAFMNDSDVAKETAVNQAMHEYVEYCRCMELQQIKEALKESNV
jgi:hypothetical protein